MAEVPSLSPHVSVPLEQVLPPHILTTARVSMNECPSGFEASWNHVAHISVLPWATRCTFSFVNTRNLENGGVEV